MRQTLAEWELTCAQTKERGHKHAETVHHISRQKKKKKNT